MSTLTDIFELADADETADAAIIDAVLAHRHVRAVVREIAPAWTASPASRPSAVSLAGRPPAVSLAGTTAASVVRPRFGRQTGGAQAARPDVDLRRPSAA